MRNILSVILVIVLGVAMISCQAQSEQKNVQSKTTEKVTKQEESKSGNMLIFKINDEEIPVSWKKNETVAELKKQAGIEDISITMSKYGGNEQVGSLGRSYTKNDKQMTTENGDIVLYGGDRLVVFYGANSWSYTLLGKIDLPEEEVTELLSKEDVTISISGVEK